MKKLVLVEKPSLTKQIAEALNVKSKNSRGSYENNEYIIFSLVGHVISAKYKQVAWTKENLPLSGLKNPEMEATFKKGNDKRKLVKNALAELGRNDYDEIISAGDADTEGSLLIYELIEFADKRLANKQIIGKIKISRIWLHGVDDETIVKAFKDRYDIKLDMPYVKAAKARGHADVEVGFNFSRLFSMKGNFNASVGRVRTAIMQIIQFREEEILNFVPENYFNIHGAFANTVQADLVSLEETEDGKMKLTTKITEQYWKEKVSKNLKKGVEYTISSVESKDEKKYPDLLPNQNDVLKNVSKLFKCKAKEVERAMQFLYENKFTSYPRSEVRYLGKGNVKKTQTIFNHLTGLFSNNINKESISFNERNTRMFNDKKVKEHFAIIPWEKKSQDQINKLTPIQKATYEYIVAKFLMCCMTPYEYKASSIELVNDDLKFRCTGKIETKKGYRNYKHPINSGNTQDKTLPAVKKGDKTILNEFKKVAKKTTPPSLMDEPALLDIMENINRLFKKISDEEDEMLEVKFSLGTPATRPNIIEELFVKYKYLKLNSKGKIETTEIGKKVLNLVKDAINIRLTAEFEQDMKKIISDEDYSEIFEKKIISYVNKIVKDTLPTFEYTPPKKEKIDVFCPLCSSQLIDTGKVFRCSEAGKFNPKTKKWSGCNFGIFKQQKPINKELTIENLKLILDNQVIESGGGSIQLDLKNNFFLKSTWGQSNITTNSSANKDEIIENNKVFTKNGILIWKNMFGKKITLKQATILFNGETLELKKCVSKAGKNYDAVVRLENGKVVFC